MSEQVGPTKEQVDVVIIGAGFVGLAAGAALSAAPASHGKVRILEKGGSVGHFWVGGHEQLSLHSPYHKLPHDGGLSRDYPMFKSKHDVRDYLARYAEAQASHSAPTVCTAGPAPRALSVAGLGRTLLPHPARA